MRITGGTVVGYEASRGDHCLVRDGVVVTDGNRIRYAGPRSGAPPAAAGERQVDARGRLVCPGFINAHFHVGTNAGDYLLTDATRGDYLGANYLSSGAPRPDRPRTAGAEDLEVGMRFVLAQALRCGATTVAVAGSPRADLLARIVGEMGLRAYLTPGQRSAEHYTDASGRIRLAFDEAVGQRGLEASIRFAREMDGAYGGRVRAMVVPRQIDTCTVDLLRASRRAATELGVPLWIHAALNLREFYDILREHCCTPIELLDRIGFLGPDVLLGHAVFLSGHSWTHYDAGRDAALIAHSGASLVHSPLKYAKLGIALESFERLGRAGVNLCLGTDTFPRDIVREMYYASLCCRLADGDHRAAPPGDVFRAATLGGARAFRRDDLGRLAPGALADVVLVDLRRIHFGAVRDPVRAVVECATGADVDTVIVDGEVLVEGGRLLRVDERDLLRRAQESADEAWGRVADWRWDGRGVDEVVPPSFPCV